MNDEDRHADEVNIAFQMGAEWQRDHMKARIEKLEATLREIETLELDPRNSGQTWVEALRQIARKALEENNDPST